MRAVVAAVLALQAAKATEAAQRLQYVATHNNAAAVNLLLHAKQYNAATYCTSVRNTHTATCAHATQAAVASALVALHTAAQAAAALVKNS